MTVFLRRKSTVKTAPVPVPVPKQAPSLPPSLPPLALDPEPEWSSAVVMGNQLPPTPPTLPLPLPPTVPPTVPAPPAPTATLPPPPSLPAPAPAPVRHPARMDLTRPPVRTPGLVPALQPTRRGPLIFAAAPPPPQHQSRRTFSVSSVASPPELARKPSKTDLARVASLTRPDEHRQRVLTKVRPTTPQKPPPPAPAPAPGDPLLLDEDPFARVAGVRMLKPRPRADSAAGTTSSSAPSLHPDASSSEDGQLRPGTPPPPVPAPLPISDDYKLARQQRRGLWLEKAPPVAVAEVVAQLAVDEPEPPREPSPPPTYFPILPFISNPDLFPLLLSFLSYSEWLALYSANNQVRDLFQSRILREFVLERYLSTVGYFKWSYEWAEPVALSLKDLHNYLRGVAMPVHQYARLSAAYLQPQIASRLPPTSSDAPDILALANTTRAYTRLVLRLRAQAESEDRHLKLLRSPESASRPGTRQPSVSSRAASPTSSHSHSRNHSHGKNERSASTGSKFSSPLFRSGRAPVLRVFVPSPEGDWLSDAGVVECEAELRRSGVLKLLRVGDIVWDVAVGDEGNLGRLVWDGGYLVDLDYSYSHVGELSPYFHSLAFSPSYFHRVVRIGGSATHNPHCNPIVYIDISPWGREIATNLQLLQDRARTETPHGALHDVVRWVHRSSFTIRPPVASPRGRSSRMPIPNVDGFYIDPGWYGTVVLESEGTNEGLGDLQQRCGPGVFPPRAESLATKMRNAKEKENRRVWRILREKSRPGEIWLRAVQAKERLM